ncbi:MAG: Spy/CpxP family protein refolding chaperone [Pseudomonadota bacterium]
MKSGFRSLVITSVLASAGFATFAQTAPQDPARAPTAGASSTAQHGGHKGMRGHHMDPAKREAAVAKRHAELKTKLKLTAEQEGAWTTFTTAMKPQARMDHQRPDRAEMEKLSTPERIDKMRALRIQHMADMNAAMDKRADATKAFYATLNADQKKVFDAEHARMGMGRHHHRRGEHHGMDGKKGGDKPATK